MTFGEWWKDQYQNVKLRLQPELVVTLVEAYSRAAFEAGRQAEKDAYAARANAEREEPTEHWPYTD